MKNQIFTLMLSAAVFTNHPLFAMDDNDEQANRIRLYKEAATSGLYEDQYAIFIPTNEEIKSVFSKEDNNKKEYTFKKGEIEFHLFSLVPRNFGFYSYGGRRNKTNNEIIIYTKNSLDKDSYETSLFTFILPKECNFQPDIERSEISETGEEIEHFKINYLNPTPLVFKKIDHLYSLKHLALVVARKFYVETKIKNALGAME